MSQLSYRKISRNVSPLSTSDPAWKGTYFSVLNRTETRTPISTNVSQLLFLAETFVEIADMSWRLFEALKILQPLQWRLVLHWSLFPVWHSISQQQCWTDLSRHYCHIEHQDGSQRCHKGYKDNLANVRIPNTLSPFVALQRFKNF